MLNDIVRITLERKKNLLMNENSNKGTKDSVKDARKRTTKLLESKKKELNTNSKISE